MVSAEELASFQKGCRKNTIGKQKQQLYNIQQEHHIAASAVGTGSAHPTPPCSPHSEQREETRFAVKLSQRHSSALRSFTVVQDDMTH
jgi:hypothetical protein